MQRSLPTFPSVALTRSTPVAALLLAAAIGCDRVEPVAPAPPLRERIVAMLDGMAETGDRSPVAYLRDHVQELSRQGVAQADAWLEDVRRIESTTDPEQLKSLSGDLRDRIRASSASTP